MFGNAKQAHNKLASNLNTSIIIKSKMLSPSSVQRTAHSRSLGKMVRSCPGVIHSASPHHRRRHRHWYCCCRRVTRMCSTMRAPVVPCCANVAVVVQQQHHCMTCKRKRGLKPDRLASGWELGVSMLLLLLAITDIHRSTALPLMLCVCVFVFCSVLLCCTLFRLMWICCCGRFVGGSAALD